MPTDPKYLEAQKEKRRKIRVLKEQIKEMKEQITATVLAQNTVAPEAKETLIELHRQLDEMMAPRDKWVKQADGSYERVEDYIQGVITPTREGYEGKCELVIPGTSLMDTQTFGVDFADVKRRLNLVITAYKNYLKTLDSPA